MMRTTQAGSTAYLGALAALGAVLGSACTGAERSEAVRTDSAGVEIVEFAGADRPLAWRFDTLYTLGGKDSGPESFYELAASAVASDTRGNLYVMDPAEKRIVAFDSSGRFLRTMGRAGGGPGELQFPFALAVAEDGTVSVFDIGKRSLVRFAPDGSIMDEVRITAGYAGGAIHTTAGALRMVVRETGDDRRHQRLLSIHGADTTALVEMSVVTKLISLPSCGMRLAGVGALFSPSLRWAAARDRTAVVTTASYEIRFYDGPRLAHVVRRPLVPQPATREAALREVGDAMQVMTSAGPRVCDADEVVDQRGVADIIPVIETVAFGPFGTLWVSRNGERHDAVLIDVLARDGEYLGTLDRPIPLPAARVGEDRIAVIVTDELDVARLMVLRVRRSS